MLDVLEEYIEDDRKVLDAVRYIEGGRNDFPRKEQNEKQEK